MAEDMAQGNTEAVTETAQATEITVETSEQPAAVTTETTETTQDTLEYGDFEVPEGFEKLDESLMAEFLPIAKESKLPKEAVQKLINMHGSTIKSVIEAQAATREANYSALMQEIKADPQLGGQKYEENLGRINAVIGKFGGDGDAFHQAIAQLAAFDTAKAKGVYATLDKIARAAAVESAIVQGDPKPAKNFYPGLPGRK